MWISIAPCSNTAVAVLVLLLVLLLILLLLLLPFFLSIWGARGAFCLAERGGRKRWR